MSMSAQSYMWTDMGHPSEVSLIFYFRWLYEAWLKNDEQCSSENRQHKVHSLFHCMRTRYVTLELFNEFYREARYWSSTFTDVTKIWPMENVLIAVWEYKVATFITRGLQKRWVRTRTFLYVCSLKSYIYRIFVLWRSIRSSHMTQGN